MSYVPIDYCVPCGAPFNQGGLCAFCQGKVEDFSYAAPGNYTPAPDLENSMNVPYPDPES